MPSPGRDHLMPPCELYGTSGCNNCEICDVDGSMLAHAHLDGSRNEAFTHPLFWGDREKKEVGGDDIKYREEDVIDYSHLDTHRGRNQLPRCQKIA
jgi:hypothetical protein